MAPKKEELTAEQKLAELEAREAELLAREEEFNKKVAEAEEVVPEVDALAKLNAALEEKFPIKLFKDSKDYIEPLFVSVNGDTILIQRGVEVQVKKKHILVINASEAQDQATATLIEELQEEYKESLKKITS